METSPKILHESRREAAKIYQTASFVWKIPLEPRRCFRKNSRNLAAHLCHQPHPSSLVPTSRYFGDSNCQKSQNHRGIVVSAISYYHYFPLVTRLFCFPRLLHVRLRHLRLRPLRRIDRTLQRICIGITSLAFCSEYTRIGMAP